MGKYRYKKWQDGPVVSGQRNTYKVFLDDVEIGEVSGTYYPFEKGLSGGFGAPEMNGRWDAWAVCPATGHDKRVKQRHQSDGIFYKRDWAADAMVRYREEALEEMSVEEASVTDREIVNGLIREAFENGKSVDQIMKEKDMSLRELAIILGRCRFEEAQLRAVSA